jgi:outer membrane receptor for ferrienterochelin and colicins
MRKIVFLFFSIACNTALFSQNSGSINGKVTDKQIHEALAGATITIKGSSTSVITDNKGRYLLRKINPGKLVLIISHVGYTTIELPAYVIDDSITIADAVLTLDERIGSAIVLTASKRAEKITNAPASINVIGAKDFDQFAGSNIGELVSKIQGVEYTRSGVDGVTFNARGFNSAFNNKVLQLVDGRNSMAALSGGLPVFNNGSYVKDDIERLEIVLGPQSALYGPNAHNAVFNAITKDPRKHQGTTASISAGSRYQFSGRIRQAAIINNKWAYKVTGEYVTGKEFMFYDRVYRNNTDSIGIPEHNVDFDFRHLRAEGQVYYSITPKADIIVSGGGSNNNFLQVTTGGRNQMRGVTYSFLQARLIHPNYFVNVYNTWGNIGTSYPIAPYTRNFWILTHPPNSLPPDSAEKIALQGTMFKEESQRLNADAQYNYNFQKAGLFLVTGLNYQKEKPNGFGVNLVDKFERIYITQYGAVLQLEKSLPWTLRSIGAIRYDHHSNFGSFFSPKLGLTKSIGEGSFRITWARAFAMPSILSQYSNLAGNLFGNGEGVTYIPNGAKMSETPSNYKVTTPLKPEEVSTWEFGYKGTIAKILFVDVNYYNGLNKNFLGPAKSVLGRAQYVGNIPVTPSKLGAGTVDSASNTLKGASFLTYFNYAAVRHYGLDAGMNFSFNKFIGLAIKYSWFGSDITKDDLRNDANIDGYVSLEETSLNAPQNRGVAILNFQNLCKQKMFISISARYVQQYDFYSGGQIGTESGKGKRGKVYGGPHPITGQPIYYMKNFDYGPLGDFISIDLSAGYRLNKMIILNVGITNLFNTKQIKFVGSPSIDRLISFELKIHVPNKKE